MVLGGSLAYMTGVQWVGKKSSGVVEVLPVRKGCAASKGLFLLERLSGTQSA